MQTLRNRLPCLRTRYQLRWTSTGLPAIVTRPSSIPWFIDAENEPITRRDSLPHDQPHDPQSSIVNSPPEDAPEVLKELHTQLCRSPHLEPSTLVVSEAIAPGPGPPLPYSLPHGKRKRGGTYSGESIYDVPGGLWSWVVMAQVKEGTENKGAIESVVRVVRKTLLGMRPAIPIPPNAKQRVHNGWAMIDGGNFAVHILSKQAKDKYFSQNRFNPW